MATGEVHAVHFKRRLIQLEVGAHPMDVVRVVGMSDNALGPVGALLSKICVPTFGV